MQLGHEQTVCDLQQTYTSKLHRVELQLRTDQEENLQKTKTEIQKTKVEMKNRLRDEKQVVRMEELMTTGIGAHMDEENFPELDLSYDMNSSNIDPSKETSCKETSMEKSKWKIHIEEEQNMLIKALKTLDMHKKDIKEQSRALVAAKEEWKMEFANSQNRMWTTSQQMVLKKMRKTLDEVTLLHYCIFLKF